MKTLIFGLATWLLTALPVFADVHLTMQDGRVSIVAKDATVRQILTEWARVGQIKIVNEDRLLGGPITLELNNVTETQALDVLLRSLSGYIAAPRAVEVANLSTFDRLIIIPPFTAARTEASASSAPQSSLPPLPVFQQAPQSPLPVAAAPTVQDDVPAPNEAVMATSGAVQRPMTSGQVNAYNGLEVSKQGVLPSGDVPQAPTGQPRTPIAPPPLAGVAVPGMVAPGPTQPGQPVRRPSGR